MARGAHRARRGPGLPPFMTDSRHRPVVFGRAAAVLRARPHWSGVVRVTAGTLTIAGAFLLVLLVGTWIGLSLVGGPGTSDLTRPPEAFPRLPRTGRRPAGTCSPRWTAPSSPRRSSRSSRPPRPGRSSSRPRPPATARPTCSPHRSRGLPSPPLRRPRRPRLGGVEVPPPVAATAAGPPAAPPPPAAPAPPRGTAPDPVAPPATVSPEPTPEPPPDAGPPPAVPSSPTPAEPVAPRPDGEGRGAGHGDGPGHGDRDRDGDDHGDRDRQHVGNHDGTAPG
jgi:hypothetical protein